MRTYIINLERSTTRKAHMKSQLTEVGIEHEFFPAIDGLKEMSEAFRCNQKKGIFWRGRQMDNTEIACFLSHRALWKKCVELNEPIAIFEDDAIFSKHLKQAYKITAKQIHSFGCIRLSHRDGKASQPFKKFDDTFCIQLVRKGTTGADAYAISPKAAKALLKHSEEFHVPVDFYMGYTYLHKIGCFVLFPSSVKHGIETYGSNIAGRSYKKTLRTKIIKEIHRTHINLTSLFYAWKFQFSIKD